MKRSLLLAALLAGAVGNGSAQGLAPFTTATGRLVLFDHGRFLEVDEREPMDLALTGEGLLFVDHAGALHSVDQDQLRLLDPGPGVRLINGGAFGAWAVGNTLKVAGPEGVRTLSTDAFLITASDSLMAWVDTTHHALMTWWRGRLITTAVVNGLPVQAPWTQGGNTLLFHDRSAHRVSMLYRGHVQVLFDSTDIAEVAAGTDLAGYWDDRRGVFRAWDRGRRKDLEPLRPRSFQAADGLLAYVANGGAFKCYRNGQVHRLLDHAPTELFVRDSLVVFVDGGRLLVEHEGVAEVVEPYVPEQWHVDGGVLTYLDLDRGIRRWSAGKRTVIAEGMAGRRFEAWGDVVLWRTPDGLVRCWWNGRVFEF